MVRVLLNGQTPPPPDQVVGPAHPLYARSKIIAQQAVRWESVYSYAASIIIPL